MKTFNRFWQFGCYLLPLLVLELYLRAERSPQPREKLMMAASLALSSLLMAAGIFDMYALGWRPLMAASAAARS